jgi:hypothetical protein
MGTTDRANPAGQPVRRWNILCTDPTFHSLAQDLYQRLYQRMPNLFLDHLQSQGTVLPEGAEPVTVASSFRGKPSDGSTVAAQTLNSGASSYVSNWTAGLADFHLEADVPEGVLHFTIRGLTKKSHFRPPSSIRPGPAWWQHPSGNQAKYKASKLPLTLKGRQPTYKKSFSNSKTNWTASKHNKNKLETSLPRQNLLNVTLRHHSPPPTLKPLNLRPSFTGFTG